MNICTIGTGERIGDWRVIGDGAKYLVERLDPIYIVDPPTSTVGKEWVTLASAITPPLATQLLCFLMEQDRVMNVCP